MAKVVQETMVETKFKARTETTAPTVSMTQIMSGRRLPLYIRSIVPMVAQKKYKTMVKIRYIISLCCSVNKSFPDSLSF